MVKNLPFPFLGKWETGKESDAGDLGLQSQSWLSDYSLSFIALHAVPHCLWMDVLDADGRNRPLGFGLLCLCCSCRKPSSSVSIKRVKGCKVVRLPSTVSGHHGDGAGMSGYSSKAGWWSCQSPGEQKRCVHPRLRWDPGGRRVSSPRYSEEGKTTGGLERRLSSAGPWQMCLHLQGCSGVPCRLLGSILCGSRELP